MKKFNYPILILLLLTPFLATAESDEIEHFTKGEAAIHNAAQSGGLFGSAYLLNMGERAYGNWTTTTIFSREASPKIMTPGEIDKAVQLIGDSKGALVGRGLYGGTNANIVFDGAQLNRNIAISNLMSTWDEDVRTTLEKIATRFSGGELREPTALINDVRTGSAPNPKVVDDAISALAKTNPEFKTIPMNSYYSGLEGIRGQLVELADNEVSVKELKIRGFKSRVIGGSIGAIATLAGTLGAGRAVSAVKDGARFVSAADNRGETQEYCSRVESRAVNCGSNTFVKFLYDTGPYMATRRERQYNEQNGIEAR